MKRTTKLLALLLTLLMLLALGACGKKEEAPPAAGGWTEKNETPSEDDAAVFAQAVAGTEYADYEPVSLLGTQVVAGTNFRFLCKTPDGAEKIVTVFRDLEKNCSVSGVEDAG